LRSNAGTREQRLQLLRPDARGVLDLSQELRTLLGFHSAERRRRRHLGHGHRDRSQLGNVEKAEERPRSPCARRRAVGREQHRKGTQRRGDLLLRFQLGRAHDEHVPRYAFQRGKGDTAGAEKRHVAAALGADHDQVVVALGAQLRHDSSGSTAPDAPRRPEAASLQALLRALQP
jgi:hypothetical protein